MQKTFNRTLRAILFAALFLMVAVGFPCHTLYAQNEAAALAALTDSASNWEAFKSPSVDMTLTPDSSVKKTRAVSLKIAYAFHDQESPFIGFAIKDLGYAQNWSGANELAVWTYIPAAAKSLASLSLMLYEENGAAYIYQRARRLNETGWVLTKAPFSGFTYSSGGDPAHDKTRAVDAQHIRKIAVGIYQPSAFQDTAFTVNVEGFSLISDASAPKSTATASTTPLENTVTSMGPLAKLEPANGHVYNGAFAFSTTSSWGAQPSDWEQQIDPAQIHLFESLSGKSLDILSFVWFFDWDFPTKMCEKISAMGKVPHLGVTSSSIKPSDIVAGKADEKIAKWAKAAKKYGKPVFFRFMAEMNGDWNSYSQAFDSTQTHELYVQAWRRVVDGFRKVGANNVLWVWSPVSVDIGGVHWTDYYPGDAYVDWVGASVYDLLGNGDPNDQILGIYNDYAARKPMMLSESGAGGTEKTPAGYTLGTTYGDNPEMWINRYFDTLENKAPRVKAIVWFNVDRERRFPIQEAASKTQLYRTRLSNPRYGLPISQ